MMNLKITHLQKGEGIRMKKNLSKKQLGVVGLAVIMAVQTPVMAAEVEGHLKLQSQLEQKKLYQSQFLLKKQQKQRKKLLRSLLFGQK